MPPSVAWWVVNDITRPGGPRGPQQTNYVVKEAADRPVNTVAGPFDTKQDAENWQTSANTAGNSPGSAAGGAVNAAVNATGLNAIGGFFSALTEKNTWLRVVEAGIGGMIAYIGLKAMFPQAVNTVTAPIKKGAKAAGMAAIL